MPPAPQIATAAAPRAAAIPTRLLSLDAFRGLTMAGMVIVNNPGDWGSVYAPLMHAEWHGWTPTDLIFPFFLFIVGVAITLSRKTGRAGPIVRRGLTLVGVGLFLNGFPWFSLATLRFPGVLQRIGICYLVTALLYRALQRDASGPASDARRARAIAALTAVLLLGYWAVLYFVPGAQGTLYDLTAEGNVGAVIDRTLMGDHLWKPLWDPEGLLSTVPAIGTTLLGLVAGLWLRSDRTSSAKAIGLLLAGAAGIVAGLSWNAWFPINKNIWTSSYVLFTAGGGAVLLAGCYVLIDVLHVRRWAHPLVVLGSNAIALFVLSGLIGRLLGVIRVPAVNGPSVTLKAWIYHGVFVPLASPKNASLLFAVANLVVLYLVLWIMYRRGVFLKV